MSDLIVPVHFDETPAEWQLLSRNNCRFACICGETFTEPVMHCPFCSHHWQVGFCLTACKNCHRELPFGVVGLLLYGNPSAFEDDADDEEGAE